MNGVRQQQTTAAKQTKQTPPPATRTPPRTRAIAKKQTATIAVPAAQSKTKLKPKMSAEIKQLLQNQ
ncbi:unnamed protein product, partial [Didymodactylos carnosus]